MAKSDAKSRTRFDDLSDFILIAGGGTARSWADEEPVSAGLSGMVCFDDPQREEYK